MIFRMVYLVFAMISVAALAFSVKMKRRNIGYIVLAGLVAVCDVICFALLGCKSVVDARNILLAYYFCYAWCYMGDFLMISSMGRRGHRWFHRVPSILICLYQTVIIISNALGNRTMAFSKHIMLGSSWWIATDAKKGSFFLSFRMYHILLFVNLFFILCLIVECRIHSAKLYRMRIYVLIVAYLLYSAVEAFDILNSWPVWIVCIAMNLFCVLCFYYMNYYTNDKLQNWSLMSFANEMSDGFILYNEYDDPIHMNDLLKRTLSAEMISSFYDKSKLEEWLSDTIIVENTEVLRFQGKQDEIYFKTRKNEILEHGEFLGTIYILHDTTDSILEIRAMEKANIELERAAKMKSDFLANMSHEIRTPMNAVIGMAEIALREELPPHVEDYLMQIQNSGRNLLNIINDILDFSKIEAGKMEIIPENYEPLSELNDVANVLATRIGDKDLELFVIIDTKMPHLLEGDSMRIRQILINLANNAIKFTREGMVLIRVLCEPVSEEEIKLNFHVIDTGQGIKKEDLDKLFVSFQQVDSKRNRSVEGTGLGLAISQKLCEAMNGEIGVTSEYGKGSDFYFCIPQKVVDPARDLVVEDSGNKHAFVINDKPEMLDMFWEEMDRLGVDGRTIPSILEYQPTGGKDFLFFEENRYDEEVREYLDRHKETMGVILVAFDSGFEPDRSNLYVFRRPGTTLAMVMILNNKALYSHASEGRAAYKIDFVSPEAKILIVDDNAINITIAEGLLRPLKAQCQGVGSGKEAIVKLGSEDFDIVLMDHMMPEMDGIETTKVIRETMPEAADIPIIALTANAMEGAKEMFIDAGMNDFVAKPIDIRDLVSKLRKWLPEEKMVRGEEMEKLLSASEEESSSDAFEMEGDFSEYEGLNYEKAIRALGSPKLYKTIVREYYRSGKVRYEDIRTAYDKEDWEYYTIKIHALKSSSRQIGAEELGAMAERLEMAGKASDIDTIHEGTKEALDAFLAVLEKLSPYFEEEKVDESSLPKIQEDEFERILNGLSEACDELDMDEMETAKEELKKYSYPENLHELMDSLYRTIDGLDVDSCMELIEKIKETGMN